jgi:hypothetical protein
MDENKLNLQLTQQEDKQKTMTVLYYRYSSADVTVN